MAALGIPAVPAQPNPPRAGGCERRVNAPGADRRTERSPDGQMDGAEPGGMDRWTEGPSCRAAITQRQLCSSDRHGQPCTAEGAERPPRASESPCPKIPDLKMRAGHSGWCPARPEPRCPARTIPAIPARHSHCPWTRTLLGTHRMSPSSISKLSRNPCPAPRGAGDQDSSSLYTQES